MSLTGKKFPRRWGLVVALVLIACGSIATESPSEDGTFSGILRLATQPIVQIDPAFISSDPEVAVANAVYDYLVDIDEDNEIQPRLATDWSVSQDGRTYTFNLAEGVTFHDGSSLTAEDVVWTFDRLRDPELGLPTADLYSDIESIEATGELEVTFNLSESDPFFPLDLSDNHALIIKEGTTEATDFNGTGPFKVVEYRPEDRIELQANPDYFVEDQPRLEKLEFVFFSDKAAALDALRSGQVDLVWRIQNALFLSLEQEPGLLTLSVPTNGFHVVRLRSDRPPGNDPLVVRALKLATDRQAIFDAVQLGLGAVGRDSPIGPLFSAYYAEVTPIPPRDVVAARSLLEEAGYSDGLELDLHTPDTLGAPDLAVVIKEQWAEAGIEINVIVEPESVYYGEGNWLEVNLGITGWGSRPTPQFYLDVMLICGAKWNESKFCDQEFDEWAHIAGTTLDEEERKAAYAQIQRILIERCPIIIPYFFAMNAAISDRFAGFALKAFPGRSDLRTVHLR